MKVLFSPVSEDNPYQKNLSNAIKGEGVNVWIEGGYPISTLRSIVKNGIPDVLHLHWITTFTISNTASVSILKSAVFFLAILISKISGIKIVWTVHNLFEHEKRHPQIELVTKSIFCKYFCDEIIVHCESAKTTVLSEYNINKEKEHMINIIPHGNYIENYHRSITKKDARRELSINPDEIVFLHFGLIREYKRIPYIMEQFKSLKSQNARLLIIGNPDNKQTSDRINRLSKSDSRISKRLEYIPADEIDKYMTAADVNVLAYRNILSSGSALLAMSFGNPVVAPHKGCLPETLPDQGNFIYEPSDKNALRNKMKEVIRSDLSIAGQSNLKKAKELDWKMIGKKTYDVYKK